MNKKQKEFKKHRILQELRFNSRTGNKKNMVKYWKNTSYEHFRVMSDILFKLCNLGFEIYSEAEFSGGGRCDLYAISPNSESYCIEILHSETEKRFNLKKETYPSESTLIKVKTKGFNKDTWKL